MQAWIFQHLSPSQLGINEQEGLINWSTHHLVQGVVHQTYQLHVLSWLLALLFGTQITVFLGSKGTFFTDSTSCFKAVSRDAVSAKHYIKLLFKSPCTTIVWLPANHAGGLQVLRSILKGVTWCLKHKKRTDLTITYHNSHNHPQHISGVPPPTGFFHHEHPSPETVLASSQSSNITTLRPSPHRETQVEGPRLPVGWVPEEHRKADWQLRSGCWKCDKTYTFKDIPSQRSIYQKCKLLLMEDVCKPQKAWFLSNPGPIIIK